MSWFSIVKKNKTYEDYLYDLQSWANNYFGSLYQEDPENRLEHEQYELDNYNRIYDELESYEGNPKKHKDRINKLEDMLLSEIDVSNLPMLPDSFFDEDTFEKEAGGVSFGGHGANPELFNIRYGKKRRDKNGKEGSN